MLEQEPEKIQEVVKVPARASPEKINTEKAQKVIFQPNPGPQTEFLSAIEQEVLYGGAAGGEFKVSNFRLLSQQCVKINFVNCWKPEKAISSQA